MRSTLAFALSMGALMTVDSLDWTTATCVFGLQILAGLNIKF